MDPEISEINLNLLAASERIIAAEYLIEKQLFPDAVNRAYYAIFHAALALLLEHGVVVKTHTGLISRFGQIFIQTGRIEKEYGRMFANAEEMREKADYSITSNISQELAENVLNDAKIFLEMAKHQLLDQER